MVSGQAAGHDGEATQEPTVAAACCQGSLTASVSAGLCLCAELSLR